MKKQGLLMISALALGLMTGCGESAKTWTVSFDVASIPSQSVKDGETAIEPVKPKKESDAQYSYTFVCWMNGENQYDFATPVHSDLSLTAKWSTEVREYTVTFDSDGGTSVAPQTVSYGETATRPENPSKAGDEKGVYVFDDWYLGESKYDFATAVTSDITLTAKWIAETKKYTIRFLAEDGMTVLQSSQVPYGETPVYEGEIPTKEPTEEFTYEFSWSKEITPVDGDCDYIATFTPVARQYLVHFDTDGHGNIEDQKVTYGDKAEEPEAPVFEEGDGEHLFEGWYLDDEKFDFANTEIHKEITLKAKYGLLVHNASYNEDAGTYVLKKCDGGTSYTDCSFIDLGDGYAHGGSIDIAFHGKFKPQVAFFAPNATKTMKDSAVSGVVFSDDAIGSDYRVWPSTNTVSGAILANKDGWKQMAYSSLDNEKDYEMELSACHGENDTHFYLSCTLYDVTGGEKTLVTSAMSDYGSEFTAGGSHLVVYGTRQCDLTIKVSTDATNTHEGGYAKASGSFFLRRNADASTSYTDASYIDLGEFENGGTVTFHLTSSNSRFMPTVQFFAEKAAASFKSEDIGGLIFHGDSVGTDYRAYPSSGLTGAVVTTSWNFAAYNNLVDVNGHELQLTIRCERSDKYNLAVTLYDVTSSTQIGSESKEFALDYASIASKMGEGKHIVVYGGRNAEIKGSIAVKA